MEAMLNWMELFAWHWITVNPWAVNAACDLVALMSTAGLAALWIRRPAAPAPAVSLPAVETAGQTPDTEVEEAVPKLERSLPSSQPGGPLRSDVRRAIAAIGRWESDYGTARGLDDLTRMVKQKRHIPTPSARVS